MILSARSIFRRGDPNWESYIKWIGLRDVEEVRSLDTTLNTYVSGSGCVECGNTNVHNAFIHLPKVESDRQYYQAAINVTSEEIPLWLATGQLLGFDLTDDTWTSSVLNCGKWRGDLQQFAKRINQYGLLRLSDARAAKDLLPKYWRKDPHAIVDIWALYDITTVGAVAAAKAS